jgi:hypothetical protein
MPGFVIQRDDGKFVTPPGQHKSYTTDLTKARVFPSREAAEADRCPENEQVVAIDNLFRR